MTKPRPQRDKPKLDMNRWYCSRCFRAVKLAGSPPDKCETCGYDGFISPELLSKWLQRDGEVQK